MKTPGLTNHRLLGIEQVNRLLWALFEDDTVSLIKTLWSLDEIKVYYIKCLMHGKRQTHMETWLQNTKVTCCSCLLQSRSYAGFSLTTFFMTQNDYTGANRRGCQKLKGSSPELWPKSWHPWNVFVKGGSMCHPKTCLLSIRILLNWLFWETADTGEALEISRSYPFIREIHSRCVSVTGRAIIRDNFSPERPSYRAISVHQIFPLCTFLGIAFSLKSRP